MKKRAVHRKSNKTAMTINALALTIACLAITPAIIPTQSGFTSNGKTSITTIADNLSSPTNITVSNTRLNETDLSWIASKSSFTTGYKILRSPDSNGTWTQIGTVNGRTATTYVDKTSGVSKWFYKIESVYKSWSTTGPVISGPPAVGMSFDETFDGAGNLNNRITQNGASTWEVWHGNMQVGNFAGYGQGVQGSGFNASHPAMAVIKTSTHDAIVHINLSGGEGAILRGKDANNYVYAGGKQTGTPGDGSFEVVIVKDGVRRVINDGYVAERPMNRVNVKASVRINEDVISVRFDAPRGEVDGGHLHIAIRDTGLMATDPDATYYGVAFTKKSILSSFALDYDPRV